jgi:hypothetical protein
VTGKTAGRLLHEALYGQYAHWDKLQYADHRNYENAAATVVNEQLRLAREDRDQLRKHVLDQAAKYEAEAFRIAPPGAPEDPPDMADYIRAETLNVAAARLRQVAGPPS